MPDIEMMHVDSLKPYGKNARTHPEAQVKKIAKSIEQFGFTNPILTDGKGGIVAGHGRVMAAKELGLKHVPTVPLDHLTKAQIRAYIIADNKLTLEGEWDEAILKEELAAIDLSDVDIELTGFDHDELADFLDDPNNSEPDPKDDEVPEVEENIHGVNRGDIWQLGEHRIMCGDSTNGVDSVLLMDSKKVAMVHTDPPYNIAYGSSKNPKWGKKWNGLKDGGAIKNDNMSGEEFRDFTAKWAQVIKLSCDGCIFVWGPPGPDGRIMFGVLDEEFHCSTTLIWVKDRITLGRGKFQNQYEPCWFGWNKSGSKFDDSDRSVSNIWEFKRPAVNDLHPTMKPVELCMRPINLASDAGEIVFDPFLGSGSTLIACEKTGRKCYGMEIDPHYCSVIIERWQQFTEKKAERIHAGKT